MYLHLVVSFGKCRQTWHTWMVWFIHGYPPKIPKTYLMYFCLLFTLNIRYNWYRYILYTANWLISWSWNMLAAPWRLSKWLGKPWHGYSVPEVGHGRFSTLRPIESLSFVPLKQCLGSKLQGYWSLLLRGVWSFPSPPAFQNRWATNKKKQPYFPWMRIVS